MPTAAKVPCMSRVVDNITDSSTTEEIITMTKNHLKTVRRKIAERERLPASVFREFAMGMTTVLDRISASIPSPVQQLPKKQKKQGNRVEKTRTKAKAREPTVSKSIDNLTTEDLRQLIKNHTSDLSSEDASKLFKDVLPPHASLPARPPAPAPTPVRPRVSYDAPQPAPHAAAPIPYDPHQPSITYVPPPVRYTAPPSPEYDPEYLDRYAPQLHHQRNRNPGRSQPHYWEDYSPPVRPRTSYGDRVDRKPIPGSLHFSVNLPHSGADSKMF